MKIKISLFWILFLCIISRQNYTLHSLFQGDKLLKIIVPRSIPYLDRFNIMQERSVVDSTFKRNKIPLYGNPEDFKIYLNYNTKSIFVVDRINCEIVIFDENGNLLKNRDQVKEMIRLKNQGLNLQETNTQDEDTDSSENDEPPTTPNQNSNEDLELPRAFDYLELPELP